LKADKLVSLQNQGDSCTH